MLWAGTLCLALLPVPVRGQYQIIREYSGSSFFDRWQFYNNFDNLTNGDAIFVSHDVASSSQLAFVNGEGNAIIKVDNTSTVPVNQKRNTVRIASTDSYSVGSLWVADMKHVPFGCSVWPAWWSQAPEWPKGGNIRTFEGVNLFTMNQMSLHTEPGCNLDQSSASLTGLINSTDCSFQDDQNLGCIVTDPRTQSYGAAFAQAGGGVFVTELAEKGISIWFFPHSTVPSSLLDVTGSVDTSTLGTPVANYPSNGCTPDSIFSEQNLIVDITLCGDFAGNPTTFALTCPGTCNDYVTGPPSNYDDAYFEIKSIRTYHDPSVKASSAPTSLSPYPSQASTTAPSSKRKNTGNIVGGVFGGILGVMLILAIFAFSQARRRRRNGQSPPADPDAEDGSESPRTRKPMWGTPSALAIGRPQLSNNATMLITPFEWPISHTLSRQGVMHETPGGKRTPPTPRQDTVFLENPLADRHQNTANSNAAPVQSRIPSSVDSPETDLSILPPAGNLRGSIYAPILTPDGPAAHDGKSPETQTALSAGGSPRQDIQVDLIAARVAQMLRAQDTETQSPLPRDGGGQTVLPYDSGPGGNRQPTRSRYSTATHLADSDTFFESPPTYEA